MAAAEPSERPPVVIVGTGPGSSTSAPPAAGRPRRSPLVGLDQDPDGVTVTVAEEATGRERTAATTRTSS